jgi:hypothetical protein
MGNDEFLQALYPNLKKKIMQKIIIKYGLISGIIAAILLSSTTYIIDKYGFEHSMYVGYATMMVSMSVIYFGIKAYRDEHNNGQITFGKGILIGLAIVLISCVLYSLAWLVIYYNFIPNFMDDYTADYLKKAKETGISAEELKKTMDSMAEMKEWYKNPLLVFLITLLEPTPVGIPFAFLFAWILKRK